MVDDNWEYRNHGSCAKVARSFDYGNGNNGFATWDGVRSLVRIVEVVGNEVDRLIEAHLDSRVLNLELKLQDVSRENLALRMKLQLLEQTVEGMKRKTSFERVLDET